MFYPPVVDMDRLWYCLLYVVSRSKLAGPDQRGPVLVLVGQPLVTGRSCLMLTGGSLLPGYFFLSSTVMLTASRLTFWPSMNKLVRSARPML